MDHQLESPVFRLRVVPVSLKVANGFVAQLHRHHKPVQGHKFSLGVMDEHDVLHGVAIAGRPVSRMLDDGFTLEVTRVCTDGVGNGGSILYGAMWRAAREMGYRKILTYTLPEESGASLRGAGWICKGEAGGGSWNCPSRRREDKHPLGKKLRWEICRIDPVSR